MTIGKKVIDRRSSYSIENGYGVCKPGLYFEKTWSGGDSPPGVRPSRYVKQFYTIKRPIWRLRRGRWVQVGERDVLRHHRVPLPQQKRTDLPPHPYTCSVLLQDDPLVQMRNSNGDAFSATTSWMFGPPPRGSLVWDANDDIRLLGKLRSTVAGSDFNMGVALAELGPAMRMVSDAALRLASALRGIRNRDYQGAARALIDGPFSPTMRLNARKSAHRNWLELQYGWMPLVKDIDSGAAFIAHQLNAPRQQRYVVRSNKRQDVISFPYTWTGNHVSVHKQIIAYIDEVDVPQLAGLMDPASVAWELLPYSFVADWVIPFGEYLDARGLASSLTGTFVTTETWRQRSGGPALAYGVPPLPPEDKRDNNYAGHTSYSMISVDLTRTVSKSLSVPPPTVKPLGKIATWKHVANAIALLSNAVR